jgi:hypothetical protein
MGNSPIMANCTAPMISQRNGHEGEQLEFVQVLGYEGVFENALKPLDACWPPSTTGS